MNAQTKEFTKRKATRPDMSRAAVEQRDTQILDAIADGASSSAFIAQHTDINRRTVQYRLEQLRAAGLIGDSSRGTYRLTGAGQAKVFAARQPAVVAEPDPTALARLPAEHQAFLRLVSDAIVARRTLAGLHAANWPGFVVLGPSKTGKTLIAQLVCCRFALDPTTHIRVLSRETPRSIWGRRVAEPGGGWRFDPAELLAVPFVALDEFDKASAEVRRAAQAFLQGDSEFAAEDDRAAVRATPLVLLNQDQGVELLPDPYLRRSVVLDTTRLLDATTDIDKVARAVLATTLPTILESLVPPAATLPEPAWQLLRAVLESCLSKRGWRRADAEPISRIVLGRWAVNPAAGAERAALAVAFDYLLCTATRAEEIADDWSSKLESAAAELSGDADAVARPTQRGLSEREFREAERLRVETARAALAAAREQLLARISHALAHVPRGLSEAETVRVAGARGQAKYWREPIREAPTIEELARLSEIVEREVLTPLREVGHDHASVAGAVAAAKESALAAKRTAAEQRRARQDREKRIDAYIRELQACYLRTDLSYEPGVLEELLRLGCVEERTSQYDEETMQSRVRRVGRRVGKEVSRLLGPATPAPAQANPVSDLFTYFPQLAPPAAPPQDYREFETKTRTWYVEYSGTRRTASELGSWGSSAVRAVLRATAGRYGRTLKEPRRAAVAKSRASKRGPAALGAGPTTTRSSIRGRAPRDS